MAGGREATQQQQHGHHAHWKQEVRSRGVERKMARRGGEELLGPARLRENSLPPPGMIFAPLRAYLLNFSLYIVRMVKYSGGGVPPLRSSARETSPPPPQIYAYGEEKFTC